MHRYLEQRLLRKRLIDPETGCWLWTGALKQDGYGKLGVLGRTMTAHRIAAIVWLGLDEDDPGACVLHKRECTSRACFNPDHLYIGSKLDNARDRKEWGKPFLGRKPKLPESDVAAILADGRPIRQIAEAYGVTYQRIWQLKTGYDSHRGGVSSSL